MSGFCPDDWHQTTEADLQQRSWGEDYHYWADVTALENASHMRLARARAEAKETSYQAHDVAIALAKARGLIFHHLPAKNQNQLLDAAEDALAKVGSQK